MTFSFTHFSRRLLLTDLSHLVGVGPHQWNANSIFKSSASCVSTEDKIICIGRFAPKNCNIALPSYTLNSIFIFNDLNLINTLILKLTTDWSQAVKLLHKLNQLLKEQLLPRRSHCRSPAKCCSRYILTSAPIGHESVTFCPLENCDRPNNQLTNRTTNSPTDAFYEGS